eukprot:6181741-Pleurochrysis_carterae.AAC.1
MAVSRPRQRVYGLIPQHEALAAMAAEETCAALEPPHRRADSVDRSERPRATCVVRAGLRSHFDLTSSMLAARGLACIYCELLSNQTQTRSLRVVCKLTMAYSATNTVRVVMAFVASALPSTSLLVSAWLFALGGRCGHIGHERTP